MLERRPRLADGTLGDLEKVGNGFTTNEQVAALGMQLAMEKVASMQKDAMIGNLGTQVAQLKIEMMLLKGGER